MLKFDDNATERSYDIRKEWLEEGVTRVPQVFLALVEHCVVSARV